MFLGYVHEHVICLDLILLILNSQMFCCPFDDVFLSSDVQNSGTGEGSKAGVKDSKSISSELAAVIDDGLYYYEQVEILAFLIYFPHCVMVHIYKFLPLVFLVL